MNQISICVGSACHLRGADAVLRAFVAQIEKHKIECQVDIEGNFCQGRCTEGVVVKINDEIITQVSREKVDTIFRTKILEGGRT